MMGAASGRDLAGVIGADYPALAGFLASFPGLEGGRAFWESRFPLWWDENPAFRPEFPRGWMLRRRGAVAGFLANVPSLMLVEGKPKTVFAVSTWMVRPEHRDASLDLLFAQLEACKGTLLFDTTPTETVASILENLGFEPLPWGGDMESLLVLRPEACLRARFPGLSWAPGLLWSAAAAVASAWQARKLAKLEPPSGLSVREAREPAPAFARLWEKTRERFAFTNVRTAEVLRWHLADKLVEKRLFACWAKDELCGYALAKTRRRRGLKVLDCADLWIDPSVPGVARALVLGLRDAGASGGFDALTVGHFSPEVAADVRAMGLPEARFAPQRRLVLTGSECRERVEPGRAYCTALQGDYGTSP